MNILARIQKLERAQRERELIDELEEPRDRTMSGALRSTMVTREAGGLATRTHGTAATAPASHHRSCLR